MVWFALAHSPMMMSVAGGRCLPLVGWRMLLVQNGIMARVEEAESVSMLPSICEKMHSALLAYLFVPLQTCCCCSRLFGAIALVVARVPIDLF